MAPMAPARYFYRVDARCGPQPKWRLPAGGAALLLSVLAALTALPGPVAASDSACQGKLYKDCIEDMGPIGLPARGMSWLAAGRFGGRAIAEMDRRDAEGKPDPRDVTTKRWYGTDIPNDFLLLPAYTLGSSDGFFTGGFKYQHLFTAIETKPPTGHHTVQNAGIAIGLEVYTASDINVQIDPNNPPRNERPYASLFYIGSVYEAIETRDEVGPWGSLGGHFLRFEFDISLTGPYSPGAAAQTTLHDTVVNAHTPQGWDSQIGTQIAPEADLLYGYELWALPRLLNLVLTARGRLGGVHQDAALGARSYITLYGEGGWFPRATLPETLLGLPLGTRPDKHGLAWSLYFAGQRRRVWRNALLQGGSRKIAQHSVHTVDAKRYVNEAEQGFALAVCGWRFSYIRTMLTGEIEHPEARDAHRYGTVSIVFEKSYR